METKTQKVKAVIALVAVVFILSFTGCKKDMGGGTPDPNEVWIQGNALNPSQITVAVNSTVLWRNKDGMAHTISGTAFSSGSIAAGGTYTYIFPVSGTFTYSIETGASASVVVQSGSTGNTGSTGTTGTTGITGNTGYTYGH